jgi:hypothetical protein
MSRARDELYTSVWALRTEPHSHALHIRAISEYDTTVVSEVIRTASFGPSDSRDRILEDLACPTCGHREPASTLPSITEDRIRMFCDCCGTFTTIVLSDEQAVTVRRQYVAPR